MIKIDKIKLKNFLSHGDSEIIIPETSKLLIDGKSGSGKSSIIDAIVWALYGKGRSDNRNLVKSGEDEATVELSLYNDDVLYRITRKSNKKGKHVLLLEEKKGKAFIQMKIDGLKNKQDWIERDLLKSSYLLFVNSVAYLQENTETFVKQPANKRKELLMEITNTSSFDELLKKAKEMSTNLSEKVSFSSGKISQLRIMADHYKKEADLMAGRQKLYDDTAKEFDEAKISLDKASETLKGLKEKRSLLEQNKQKKVDLETQISSKTAKMQSKLVQITDLEKIDIESIKKETKSAPEIREQISAMDKKLEKSLSWQSEYNKLMSDRPLISDKESQIADIEKRLMEKIKGNNTYCKLINGECPTLTEMFSGETKYLEERLKVLNEENKKQIEQMNVWNAKVAALGQKPEFNNTVYKILKESMDNINALLIKEKEWETATASISAIKQDISELDTEISMLNVSVDKIKETCLNIEKDLLKMNDVEKMTEELLVKTNMLSSSLYEIKLQLTQSISAAENLEKTNISIKEEEAEMKKSESTLFKVNLAKEAFGNSGIKSIIIDYLIPSLETKINTILSKLSDFRISLETQRTTLSDTLSEGLFINIYNEKGESFDFDNYSGGEKLKIVVAISEALSEMQKIGFRLIDELFIGLDEESTESFSNIMSQLQERFSQIICISHLRQIKDGFTDVLTVKKVDNTSVIM